ncbi:MAG: YegS/Rv2252/BmrU family lipid kinase [Clostridiaceae bacterium]|nr:YegS/Rv2252/BmrU family lipid kinase [Clostridiaceae bacterium]
MRHVFIINPAAGRHDMSSVAVKRIEEACHKHRLEYDIYLTAHPMHAVDIVKKVGKAHDGNSLIFYACGGDGTLNEVAAGISELDGDCAFTSYPIGTGNDYVKMFSGGKQAFLDLDRLLLGSPVDIDYIRSDCGCAINVLSVGLDAQVAMRKDKYRFLGGGIIPYVLSAAESVIRGIGQEYYVNIDGRQFDGEYTMIFIGNGRFYGGGFCPVPHSDIGDGILDVLMVKKISRLQAAFVVSKYKNGRYRELEQFITYMPAKEIKVFSKNNEDMCINLDGETVQSSHISMRIEPQRLRFVVPNGAFPIE